MCFLHSGKEAKKYSLQIKSLLSSCNCWHLLYGLHTAVIKDWLLLWCFSSGINKYHMSWEAVWGEDTPLGCNTWSCPTWWHLLWKPCWGCQDDQKGRRNLALVGKVTACNYPMMSENARVHHVSCGSSHACSFAWGRSKQLLVGAGLEPLLHCKFTPSLLPATGFPIQACWGKGEAVGDYFDVSRPISCLFQNLTCELSLLAIL